MPRVHSYTAGIVSLDCKGDLKKQGKLPQAAVSLVRGHVLDTILDTRT